MPNLDDVKKIDENTPIGEGIQTAAIQDGQPVQENTGISVPEWLKAKTGEGSVEQYLEHPLNFSKNMGLARVIRGATGIMGALDLAIIDIGIGLLEFFKGKGKNVTA